MNKIAIWIIGGIIVVGGIVAVFVYTNKSVNITNTDTGQTTEVKTGDNAIVSVDACDILTQDIAKNILGDAAKKGDLPGSQASTKDVSVSSCVYTARIDANGAVRISNTKGVSVLVRAAKTNAGSDSNKSQFGTNKPAGVQDVDGIGDKAFFNPVYGQLNVLKGGNWYIIANYSGTAGSGTLESDKQLAGLLQIK